MKEGVDSLFEVKLIAMITSAVTAQQRARVCCMLAQSLFLSSLTDEFCPQRIMMVD